jgi:hypothetical protein
MSDAYAAGEASYKTGSGLSRNPYAWGGENDPCGHYHTAWNDGWMAACGADTTAGRLHKMLRSSGVSMETCRAAEERMNGHR